MMGLEIITSDAALERGIIGESHIGQIKGNALIEFESEKKAKEWVHQFLNECYIPEHGDYNAEDFPIKMFQKPAPPHFNWHYRVIEEFGGQTFTGVLLVIPENKVEEVQKYIDQTKASPN